MEFHYRNVNQAFTCVMDDVLSGQFEHELRVQTSRNGDTYEFIEPVFTHFERPYERVLFHPARDANPFFHFFESLWMLAGRNDVKFVASMVKRMAQYSDDGRTAQGAYGYRWRTAFGADQLKELVEHLKAYPDSRRAVLTMWSPHYDLIGVDCGEYVRGGLQSKDIPCNTQAYFKLRDGKLNMTVCCRSNDLIWGAYGANAVHFSMLQEYMAGKLGVGVGRYTQMSDSLHIYTGGEGGKVFERIKDAEIEGRLLLDDPYTSDPIGAYSPYTMGAGDPAFDRDLRAFFEIYDNGVSQRQDLLADVASPFFQDVVVPMWCAYQKRSVQEALRIKSPDWRRVCVEWLERHAQKELF